MRSAVGVVFLLVAVAGCDSSPSARGHGPVPTAGSVRASRAYDPPTHFDVARSVGLPPEAGQGKVNLAGDVVGALPVTLYRAVAYMAAPDHLQVVDTGSGHVIATIRPSRGTAKPYISGGLVGDNPAQPPLLATVENKDLVVVPFTVTISGRGTTPSHQAVDLVAVDAPTGREVSSALVDLEPSASDLTSVSAALVGLDGTTAVLRVTTSSGSSLPETYAVDLPSGRTVWKKSGFAAYAVAGSTAVGTVAQDASGVSNKIAGMRVTDGHPVWTTPSASYEVSVFPGGSSVVVAIGRNYADGTRFLQLIDAKSGAVKDSGNGDYGGASCSYDGAAVTVCARNGWAAAFDATSLKWLWSLPDTKANRVAPSVTSAWHGAVYGTTDNGPVILDARTGQDRATAPGAAPYVVDGNVGIGLDPKSLDVRAYPANG